MKEDAQRWLLAAGVVLIALGVGLGFGRSIYDGNVRCGTAFREDFASQLAAAGVDDCAGLLSDAVTMSVVLILLGTAAIATVAIVSSRQRQTVA
jgi:hypothetical protein